jgi:cytochrome c oxidase accessory protein FixG
MSVQEDSFRDHIATVNEKGKRIWIFPKRPKGPYFKKRALIGYLLLAQLFLAPHIYIKDEPLLLFDILERKFVLFGKVFWPQDLYIFALLMIIGLLFITLFTIIFGRLFCGWACPQTIFMELVFRRIEYWIEGDFKQQKALAKAPWSANKALKRFSKHAIFWGISFVIANTFLAYIIGAKLLWKIQTDPLGQHMGGFMAILIFTTVFYFVFSKMREQICTTICPYGRLQGVLLDQNSMVVAYDYVRGENRAKIHKGEDRKLAQKGDCIDCFHCVHVCPTGIDIRNGTQLECVNCTACIDACDDMMEKVGLPKGLVRIDSENGIKSGQSFQWTKRVMGYIIVLALLFSLLITLLLTRKDFETTILRQRGSTYQMKGNGFVTNIFEINLTNKSKKDYHIELELEDSDGKVELVVQKLILKKEAHLKERFVMKFPFSSIKNGMKLTQLKIIGNGKEIDQVKVKFIGPML